MHSKLLYKINKFGIAGKLYNWLGDIFHDRSQSVRVNNSISKPYKVLSGVPQGSPGPYSFLIFISDIYSVSDNHNVIVKLLPTILNCIVLYILMQIICF